MKKALTLIFLLILSYTAVAVGRVNEIQPLWYAGLGFGAAVLLAMVIGVIKMTGRFMSQSVSSGFFVTVALAIVGVLSWQSVIPAFLGYSVGTILGICLFMIVFRKLAQWAQTSMIFGEVFQFVSAYQVRSYLTKETLVEKQDMQVINIDFKNVCLVLKQMGYQAGEAKEAATYALAESTSKEPLEDKIKRALQYFGENSVEMCRNREN